METSPGFSYTLLICLFIIFACSLYASFQNLPRIGLTIKNQIFVQGMASAEEAASLPSFKPKLISLETETWNSILNAKDIFPTDVDQIKFRLGSNQNSQVYSSAVGGVVSELENLLKDEEVLKSIYDRYLKTFDFKRDDAARSVGSAGYEIHKNILKKNLIDIAKHNVAAREGRHSWEQGINQFSDMTEKEMRPYRGGVVLPNDAIGSGEDK